jgi:anthranilate synthase/aminodeoxychorismate synthase-like glutamine amidotransferase
VQVVTFSALRSPCARVQVVDNYDSFTYNTAHLLGVLGAEPSIVPNDGATLEDIAGFAPDGILLSAGPGTPDDAGITLDVIRRFRGKIPLLGICLGHQAIACAYGGQVRGGGRLLHGKLCPVEHDASGLFSGLPNPVQMARYNSLLVDPASLPRELVVTARSEIGEVMALEQRQERVQGVQFHPESVLSELGARLLANWLAQL